MKVNLKTALLLGALIAAVVATSWEPLNADEGDCPPGDSAAAAPSCANPVGSWTNELGSTLTIRTYNKATGAITGEYISPSGGGAFKAPIVGWMMSPSKQKGKHYAPIISFSANWSKFGSITSWTGTCTKDKSSGKYRLDMMWNYVNANADFVWKHVNTGKDIFFAK